MADVVLELPKRIDGVFSAEDHKRVFEHLNQPGWETGWKSNGGRDAHSFLHKHFAGWVSLDDDGNPHPYDCEQELQQKDPFLFGLWRSAHERLFKDYRLVRCYSNAMAYGMDGYVHTDSRDPNNYTAVYYPHARWSPNWGGETIFYNQQENRVTGCFFPRPNSIVLFDGRIPHRANGVTRSYTGVRITLMFKMTKDENVSA